MPYPVGAKVVVVRPPAGQRRSNTSVGKVGVVVEDAVGRTQRVKVRLGSPGTIKHRVRAIFIHCLAPRDGDNLFSEPT